MPEKKTVQIFYNETIETSASVYFDKAKKARRKLEGAQKALDESKKKLKSIEKKESKILRNVETYIEPKKHEWYEKFRWFYASNKMLVIGGRDATTNEIIIKKHTEPGDIVFHTDMQGSPFFVLKTNGREVDKEILEEIGDATCSFSKAWQLGLMSTSVFYVSPEQITKTPNTGEYLKKGSFVIKGKTNYVDNKINLGIGLLDDNRIMCAPKKAIEANCTKSLFIEQGDKKVSEIAKKVRQQTKYGDLDYIIRILPTGSIKIKNIKNDINSRYEKA